MENIEKPLFEVMTPINFTVRTSLEHWQRILIKHPDLTESFGRCQNSIANPNGNPM